MKKALGILLSFSGVLFLSACSFKSFAYEAYRYGELKSDAFVKEEHEGYYRVGDYSAVKSADESFTTFDEVCRDKYNDGRYDGHLNLPATGKQKILVIPVDFSDYAASDKLPSDSQAMIEQSFFGSDAHSQFYSVASYFDKASYGRLHLEGKVTSWYRSSYTYSQLSAISGYTKNNAALQAIRLAALTWYAQTYPEDPIANYSFSVGNGSSATLIPTLYFVYSCPTMTSSTSGNFRDSMLWAFTIRTPGPTSWSGFDLTYLKDGAVDSHTYIHEMGHILGLKDYYDANGSSDFGACSPTGRMDMMDYSLGDESAYSKLLLNWTRPYVPTASTTISLRPFSTSGDCVLLSPSWNGSPFSEYLLLEYYTPNYLNRVDSTLRSEENRLFQKSGLIAYHVDSRLGYFDNKISSKGYVTASTSTSAYKVDIANTNSASLSGNYVDTSSILLQLLDKSSFSGKLIKNYVASDHQKSIGSDLLRDSLFYEGDGLRNTSSSFSDLTFHDGSALNFSFEVGALTSTYCTLKITLK